MNHNMAHYNGNTILLIVPDLVYIDWRERPLAKNFHLNYCRAQVEYFRKFREAQ